MKRETRHRILDHLWIWFNAALIVPFVYMALSAGGCAAPQGVVNAAEDMKVPVEAMANRYTVLVKLLKEADADGNPLVTPADKLELLDELRQDLAQFSVLHGRLVEYLEGTGKVLDPDNIAALVDYVKDLKAKLDND